MKDRRNVALLLAVGALLLWTSGAQWAGWSVFAVVVVVAAVMVVVGLLVEREVRLVRGLTKDPSGQHGTSSIAAAGSGQAAEGKAQP